jgi:lactate dehydrogenase-like 2-hydroxyacid dehydrogenase
MRHRVVITHWIHPEIVEFLAHLFDVVPNMGRKNLSSEEVRRRAGDAEAIMVSANDRIDGPFLDHCPRLRVVAGASEASGKVDVQACTERGIWVTRAPAHAVSRSMEPNEATRAAALEGAANILEALLGQRPGGAINTPDGNRGLSHDRPGFEPTQSRPHAGSSDINAPFIPSQLSESTMY